MTMLKLAQAVYPQHELFDDAGMCWQSVAEQTGCAPSSFNPINNAAQFCEVLAWLTKQDEFSGMGHTYVRTDFGRYHTMYPHDGTAAGIRSAVVEAALKVVEDKP